MQPCDVTSSSFDPARYDVALLFNIVHGFAPAQNRALLGRIAAALKPGGVLFSSNPRGDNEEGWSGERYGAYYNYASWSEFVTAAGFSEITHYYRPPGLPVSVILCWQITTPSTCRIYSARSRTSKPGKPSSLITWQTFK